MNENNWIVYLLRCSDNSLYCWISNGLKSRLINHNSGKGAKYTRSRKPVESVGASHEMTKSEALKLEYRINGYQLITKFLNWLRKRRERN
ncbi:MAG: GIY-YIG nuclease family protein [Deltaproteobacteria bacterium]|nr:GIY-YIG nuclease family protein [Deltaproteobacteria bacterium]